jgi:hypothetical protein
VTTLRPHPPKTAALVAYDAGALSSSGRTQLETHLAACETCRTELASIRLWSRESARMRAIKTVPVDFSKMELALAREAKSQAREVKAAQTGRRVLPMLAPLALAATVLLTIGFDRLLGGAELVSPGPATEGPVLAASVGSEGAAEVVLVAGDVVERHAETELVPGRRIAAPSILDARSGEAHLSLLRGSRDGGSAGVAILANTSLGLVRVDGEGGEEYVAELELLRGSAAVRADVAGFHGESRVVVLAGGYRIEAEVAVFDATLTEGFELVVHEGAVRVTGLGADVLLTAPARFAPPQSSGAIANEVSRAPSASELALGDDAVLVRVERPSALRWELEGPHTGGVEGRGALAFRMAPGSLRLVSIDGLGQRFSLVETVGPDGLLVAGEPLEPTAPTLRGYLDPAVINGVVRGSLPSLQRCYEHALRLRPDLGGGALRARVTVATDGTVLRTRIDGADVPTSLQSCVTSEASRWTFPSPGAPVSFELPLSFHSR